jgi:hypothetical protein
LEPNVRIRLAPARVHRGHRHHRHEAGANSVFDGAALQSLVALDAAVASADAALIQDQIAVFKALGGGWEN